MTVRKIELEAIHNNPFQKRHNYNDIPDLARTIAEDGLEQMPKARLSPSSTPRADGEGNTYQLKFGHRRAQAFRWLRENWEKEQLPNRYDGYTVMPLDVEDLTDEQMFRGATIENSQRSDLSPIERMEEMKAWVEFGYNSKQIAALYPGMSDSTVRGLLSFDQLVPEAKEALHDGRITQGTARALLSIQKIATEKDVVETIKRIEKNEDAELPETIIENAVDNFDHVKEMWDERFRDGKPKSQHHSGGWLLDLKKFPNDLLPVLSVMEAAAAIGIPEKDKDSYELVKEWMLNGGEDGSKTTEAARNALEFSGLRQEFIDRLLHLVDPPACSACPFYTKMHGKHYCGVKLCHARKTEAWQKHVIKAASKKLGIAIYQGNDLKYVILQHHAHSHEALFKKRHKDLRLLPKECLPERGYYSQYGFEGVEDDIFFVVAVGETASKLVGKSNSKGTARVDKDTQRRNKMLIQRKKELLWELTATVKTIFECVPQMALAHLNGWHYVGKDNRPINVPEIEEKEEEDMSGELLSRLLVWGLIEDNARFDHPSVTCVEFVNELHAQIAEWGIKPLKGLVKMAEKFDVELTSVSAETETKKGR